jgi:deoxyribose-phosphate aldolase
LLDDCLRYGFAAACVNPIYVPRASKALAGSGTRVCTVAGFPLGSNKSTLKAIEASSAVKEGAHEVDLVAHLPYLATGDLDAARNECLEVARAARAANPNTTLKLIIESAYLLTLPVDKAETAIEVACQAARQAGFDFVKTSTGFHPAGGASVRAVELMAKYGAGLKIKASGGIRTLAGATAMLNAGATRLGCSAGVSILAELSGAASAKPAAY